jgi:TPR repeat protein
LEGRELIQISAPISPGSSGGPVLTANGEVIGVAVGTLKSGQNLNFAVPASVLWKLLRGEAGGSAIASQQSKIVNPQPASDVREAAEQGYAEAQFTLGGEYALGHGVPRDYGEAAKWYRKAAEQGYARAQFSLGFSYYFGHGVPQDYGEAAKWYRKAAEQGYADAQFYLGFAYANGDGVPQDDALAYMWLNLAAAQATGEQRTQSARWRDTVAARMTSSQIAEAQHLAREWRPNPSK